MLLTWMLGRILLAHGRNPDVLVREGLIKSLGHALARSKLLFKRGDWGSQLAPHLIFRTDADWHDT
jgi:hypothetical protein